MPVDAFARSLIGGVAANMTPLAGGIFNAKPSNTANLRRVILDAMVGTARGRILIAGDSTARGHGTSSGPFYGGTASSWHIRFANLLAARGVPVNTNYVMAASNCTTFTGGGLDYATLEPRATVGTGWSIATGQQVPGGSALQANVGATGSINYNFGSFAYDTIDLFYIRTASSGTIAIDRAGTAATGSPLATLNAGGTIMGGTSLTVAGAPASGILNIGPPSGGSVYLAGVGVRNSLVPAVEFLNCAIGASTASGSWTGGSAFNPKSGMAIMNPSVLIIELGVNDLNGGVSPATFTTGIQGLITAYKSGSCDVIIKTPIQSDPSQWPSSGNSQATNLALHAVYVDALKALATSNDVPLILSNTIFGTYAEASARGYYSDSRHGSQRGYLAEAASVNSLLQMMGI